MAVAALQLAVAKGCDVFVTSSKPAKLAAAREMGAKGGVLYTDASWPKQLAALLASSTGSSPSPAASLNSRSPLDTMFDLVIDGSGGPALNEYLRLVRSGGKIVLYGATAGLVDGDRPFQLHTLFLRNVSLRGSTMGSDRDFAGLVEFVAEHRLVPLVDACFPLSEYERAFDRMRHGQQMGKLVLICDQSQLSLQASLQSKL